MAEHYRSLVAVMLILEREADGRRELLLQRRQNTGYADGLWDVAVSGHLEEGESLAMAVVREAGEELGITVRREDLRLVTVTHKYAPQGGKGYLNHYFVCGAFTGTPRVSEPDKCAGVEWFDREALPVADMVPDRMRAIRNYEQSVFYSEWD